MIETIPTKKSTNIVASNKLVLFEEPLNSFQIKTPHNAATRVAPWPSPYEIAAPAFPAAIRLNELPIPQIIPPKTPTMCILRFPLK